MKGLSIAAATVAALTLTLSSCRSAGEKTQTIANVQIAPVQGTGITTVTEFPGRVKAAEEVNIAFKLSGTLQKVYVKEGSRVRKGQIIAELDSRDYQTQLQAVEGEYLSVKSEAERVIGLYADSVATEAAYDKARYGLQQITAKYKNAQDQLADTKVYAPFDGFVQDCLFDAPTIVAAGMPVVILVSSKDPEIEINIPAATYIHRYDIVSLSTAFDFIEDKNIPLSLVSITPKANANQLYTMRLGLPSGLKPLPSPGMSAMVKVGQKVAEDDMEEIPASALFEKNGRSFVWIYSEDGTVSAREVVVRSLHIAGTATIFEGLQTGEKVVISGVHSLKEGEKVKLLPEVTDTNVGGLL